MPDKEKPEEACGLQEKVSALESDVDNLRLTLAEFSLLPRYSLVMVSPTDCGQLQPWKHYLSCKEGNRAVLNLKGTSKGHLRDNKSWQSDHLTIPLPPQDRPCIMLNNKM